MCTSIPTHSLFCLPLHFSDLLFFRINAGKFAFVLFYIHVYCLAITCFDVSMAVSFFLEIFQ